MTNQHKDLSDFRINWWANWGFFFSLSFIIFGLVNLFLVNIITPVYAWSIVCIIIGSIGIGLEFLGRLIV